MSDRPIAPARPVSIFTIALLFAVFAAFLAVVRYLYHPVPVTAYNAEPESLPKDLQWRATAKARREALAELKGKEQQQAAAYAWIDQNAGVVQLPIERAMELTVRQYAEKK
ncbi:MAG: hypothetical protein FJ399_01685 [Verrucomicrobia bacterium]|nr:hypothetical protein [Verrucomicrobiota bacterium]